MQHWWEALALNPARTREVASQVVVHPDPRHVVERALDGGQRVDPAPAVVGAQQDRERVAAGELGRRAEPPVPLVVLRDDRALGIAPRPERPLAFWYSGSS